MTTLLELEGRLLFSKDGDLFFICKTIDGRIPPHLIPRFASLLPNLPVFWRHQTPQKEKYKHQPVFGRIVAARGFAPMGVVSVLRIYGNSVMPSVYLKRQALQKWIEKLVSSGIKLDINGMAHYKQEGGVSSTYDEVSSNIMMYEAEPLEVSITPYPACETCTPKPKVRKMTPEKEGDKAVKPKTDELDKKTKDKIDRALEEATIEELQGLLDSSAIELEKVRTELENLKGKVSTKGDAITILKKELEDKNKTTQTLEDKVQNLTDSVGKLMEELESEKRRPFIEDLKEHDKKGIFDDEDIASMSITKIQAKIVILKEQEKDSNVTSKIKVTTMEQSVKKARKKVEEREKEDEDEPDKPKTLNDFLNMSIEELEKHIDPETEFGKSILEKRDRSKETEFVRSILDNIKKSE